MYGDEEETWQVAGRRRRRVSNPAGDCNSQQQQHPPKVVVQTGTRDRNSNGSADRKRKPRHRTTGGYSYTKNSSGVPIEASQENRVQEELRKLDHLKGLLRGTTLWKRLVDGLASILPQLGLSVPLPLREAAESMTETGVPLIATKDEKSSSLLRQKEDRKCDEQRVACFPTAGGPTLRQGGQAAGATGAGVWSESLDAGQGRLHSSPAHEAGEDNSTKGSTGGGVALRELVCYGIGNFSETHASRYQLAVALCLRDLLFPTTSSSSTSTSSRDDARNSSRSRSSGEQVQKSHPGGHKDSAPATMMTATATSTPNVSQDRRGKDVAPATAAAAAPTAGVQPAMLVFDPVMGDAERAILAALGCGVLNTNEEGKRSCFASVGRGEEEASSRDRRTPTLFFMPHCPQRLYSNLLWANWSSPALGSMLILGNKLSAYADRELSGQALADPSNAILRAAPLLQEMQLQPYQARDKGRWREDVEHLPHAERAFNDLTLSYSCPEARGSVEGIGALLNRPLEFLEETDGELVTGRATAVSGS